MGLSTELISQFAKITNDKKTDRIDEVTLYGEVAQCDDSICVRFDGSDQLTPVTTITEKDEEGNITNFKYGAASVKTGDRVSVSLKNHSATITGNLSDPPMGRAEVVTTEDSILLKIDDKIKMQIDALGVKIDGLVEITNGLENGTTTIDGACIKTGKIEAERLNLTGSITFGDLNSDVQEDITSAQETADNAQSAADTANTNASSALTAASNADAMARAAENRVTGWTYSGSTYIDGTKIQTGTVTASTLEGGQINLLNAAGQVAGMLDLTQTANGIGVGITSGSGIRMLADGNVFMQAGNGPFITLDYNNGYVSLGGGSLVVGSAMYGYSLPAGGTYGQLFFLLS